jgi:hypothetical protein
MVMPAGASGRSATSRLGRTSSRIASSSGRGSFADTTFGVAPSFQIAKAVS